MAQVHDKPGYRDDLDGLRGLAIALVAGYHVWVGRVSGGVDVFLALSGFFLAVSVLSRVSSSSGPAELDARGALLKVVAHWKRMALRLLPSAIVVIAVSVIATWALLPKSRWLETSQQSIASLLYVENWHLARNRLDYNAADLAVSPLQHFWSLSVQGQLFAVLPLIWLVATLAGQRWTPRLRSRRAWLVVTVPLCLASFAWAVRGVASNQSWAYYDTFARGWELLAGAVVALLLPDLRKGLGRIHPWAAQSIQGLALVAIVSCGVAIDGSQSFPGVATLWPVGAALLVVVLGDNQRGRGVNRILAARPFRVLGDHAYTLYLWHWPVLILWLNVRDVRSAGFLDGAAILSVSFAAAALTHRWVERPLREGSPASARAPRPLAALVWGTAAAVIGASTFTIVDIQRRIDEVQSAHLDLTTHPGAVARSHPGLLGDVDEHPIAPAPWLAGADQPLGELDGCLSKAESIALKTCRIHSSPSGRRVVLVGGSHVTMFDSAFALIGAGRDLDVTGLLRNGCSWSLGFSKNPRLYDECVAWGDRAEAYILRTKPDLVITTGTRDDPDGPGDFIPAEYPIRWFRVVAAGIPVVLLRDTPNPPLDVAGCVERYLDEGRPRIDRECSFSRNKVLSTTWLSAAPALPDVDWIDVSDVLCTARSCPPVIGNVLVYRDREHLTATFARTLALEIDRQLGRATGWWDGLLETQDSRTTKAVATPAS